MHRGWGTLNIKNKNTEIKDQRSTHTHLQCRTRCVSTRSRSWTEARPYRPCPLGTFAACQCPQRRSVMQIWTGEKKKKKNTPPGPLGTPPSKYSTLTFSSTGSTSIETTLSKPCKSRLCAVYARRLFTNGRLSEFVKKSYLGGHFVDWSIEGQLADVVLVGEEQERFGLLKLSE